MRARGTAPLLALFGHRGSRRATVGLWEIEVKALSKTSLGRPQWHPEVAVR
jgi:hypothetical protein